MAINDVSLTAGMRSNLLSLQNTVNLLDRTQSRLSSGKKVNTAIDNPVSFFAAQSLTSRASIIDGLKDAMGQAVQTITAADKGITAITSMIEQAKGIAQSALSAAPGTDRNVTLTVGGDLSGGTADQVYINMTGIAVDDTIVIDGVVLTATDEMSGSLTDTTFRVFADPTITVTDLQSTIVMNTTLSDAYYYPDGGEGTPEIVQIGKLDNNWDPENIDLTDVVLSSTNATSELVNGAAGDSIVIGGVTLRATFNAAYAAASDTLFYAGHEHMQLSAAAKAVNLANEISNNATLAAAGYSATASDDVITLQQVVGGVNIPIDTSSIIPSSSDITVADLLLPSAELVNLQDQYNEIRDQLTELAEDSGYKGKNLLSDDILVVKFEGTDLSVKGFDASAGGLKIDEATWTTGEAEAKINASLTALDGALTTLCSESSKLSGNLSIITVRQDFSTNMINTLTQGADKLTLADANEEGGNMLMLQTRQSLSTSALSMSAQAAQSVLRLFQ
jgi:flagellin-like hook-associated protein FlgL